MNFEPRDDGAYTNQELLKCQAFIVFCHAEIQVYLETVSRRIMTEAKERWTSNAVYVRVIAALIAFRRQERVTVPQDPKRPSGITDINEIIQRAFVSQTNSIAGNNGIKRANVAELLAPLGILPNDLEEPLLIQLDQIGSNRGDMVHKSSRVSLRNIRDPFTDEQTGIYNLITEIQKFDEKLQTNGLLSSPPI